VKVIEVVIGVEMEVAGYLVPLPPCHPGTHGTRVAMVAPLSGTTISIVV
jgi:hypothetical protein